MSSKSIPIEDIGVVVLDHQRITITQGAMNALIENRAALVTCDKKRMPIGLILPLEGNTIQCERIRQQLESSLPLRKQLWQQTVKAKIENQAAILAKYTNKPVTNLCVMAKNVRSADPDNFEAQAAVYYWKNFLVDQPDFVRSREGSPPNNLLNYGYAILRSVVARSLVISGLLPVYGIHHHNKYNPYGLADDIMEPYRPYVDMTVLDIVKKYGYQSELNVDSKKDLLCIPAMDVKINGKRRPLMIAVSETSSSLVKCFSGEARKISYPDAYDPSEIK